MQVSSCCTQTSGELVTVTGTEQQTALRVVDGDVEYGGTDSNDTFSSVMKVTNTLSSAPSTRVSITNSSDTDGSTLLELNHHGTAGNALVITNTATQSSGNLVSITGTPDQNALYVDGDMEVTGTTKVEHVDVCGHLDVTGGAIHLPSSPPTSATDTGEQGEIRHDSTHLYICIATDIWRRIEHHTF